MLSFYDVSVPVCRRVLNNLDAIIVKAAEHTTAHGIDEGDMLAMRLYPDMFPLLRQVQIACDLTMRGMSRLAGQEPPSVPDTEQTFSDLRARIAKTIEEIDKLDAGTFSEKRTVTFPAGGGEISLDETDYLLYFVLPNVFFHITTAYNILRTNGVALGKADFLGPR